MDYVESRSDGCPSAARVDRETVSVETRDSETRATSPISEVRTRKRKLLTDRLRARKNPIDPIDAASEPTNFFPRTFGGNLHSLTIHSREANRSERVDYREITPNFRFNCYSI